MGLCIYLENVHNFYKGFMSNKKQRLRATDLEVNSFRHTVFLGKCLSLLKKPQVGSPLRQSTQKVKLPALGDR